MLSKAEFTRRLNKVSEEERECEVEIRFEPFADKDTGEIVGVAQVNRYIDCGEEWVVAMFTDGSKRAEYIASQMGFREYDEEEEG
jgi:hypothetical protein